MDPKHLEEVCEAFDLGTPVSVEENQEGVLNLNYSLITDRGHFFIKSVRDRRKDSIPVIAAAERFMQDGGLPAVAMMPRTNGEVFLSLGSDVYTVYPYLEHSSPHEIPYEALGAMLARIHARGTEPLPELLQAVHMTEKRNEVVATKLAAYKGLAASGNEPDDTLFLSYIDTKLELLDRLPTVPAYTPTLVHGDYHVGNILFNKDGQVIGICDWEKAELAPRAYEIARSVQYIAFESRDEPYVYERDLAIERGREFLSGYRGTYPISDDELRAGFALRLRKLVMSFWIEEGFYDRGDSRANKFIANETNLIKEFTNPETVEELIA